MENFYESANPFGKLDIKSLENFERTISYHLPQDYRSYLLNFNGAEPVNPYCNVSDEEGDAKVHNMLGIHNGPEYAKLETSFGDNNSTRKTGILAFAYDEGGNYFCICLKPECYGAIYYYDHESSEANRVNTLVKISNSFEDFIKSLFSEQDFELKLAENYPEVYERILYFRNNPKI